MTDQREQQLNETEDAGRVRQSVQDDGTEPKAEQPGQSAHESIQDSAISCLLIIAGLLHARVSPGQVEQLTRFSAHPLDMAGLVHLARKVGLRAKPRKIDHKHTSSITSPVIAQCNDGSFFVLARVEQSPQGQAHALVLFPQERSARRVTIDELWSFFTGSIVVLSDKSMMSGDVSFGFRWFLQSVLKFKKDFVCVFLAAFVIQLIGILTPLMTQVVVDKVLVHREVSVLVMLSIAMLIGYVFELVLGIAKNYVFSHTTNRIDVTINWRLFRHLFALPLRYFESRKVGETVARMREAENIRSFLTGTPLSSLLDVVFIVVYIVVLFFYSVPLTFVVIASIPVFAVLSAAVTPMFRRRLDEKFYAGSEAQSFLVESIGGVQTVKSFAIEPRLEHKWGKLQSRYATAGYRTSIVAGNANAIGKFIQEAFDLLVLFLGAQAVMNGAFSVGELVAFRMLAGRVSGPVLRFVQLWQDFQQASMSVSRIGDIFGTPPEPGVGADRMQLPRVHGNVRFDHVSFRYRPDTPCAVEDMSFSIPAGMTIGVCGRSGSGKSTITKLIQRLYVPQAGKISIDGMDISLADPSWLRGNIGVVLQENFMFSGTVAENIAIRCPGAGMDCIVAAAKLAGAHEFILGLQDGYDTMIGEKGVGLSGGQKQRIAIARAIIDDPRILIFDEATSALDYESESIIQHNLKAICKGRTVIIVAHRLSTIEQADRIMVVDRGRVKEYDTPQRLLASHGLYWRLHELQRKGEVC